MPMKINIKDKVNENVCDLSLGELEEIPTKEIAAFKRVTILDLSLNRLATLGTNFCILNRLVKLDLSKNRLRYLPDEFGLLQQLRYLDLFGNQLEHLPLSFGDLHNLRYLDLHNNPLNAALAKITGPCLTNRDCQESAKKTVNFMSLMQVEVLKVKKQYMDAMLSQNPSVSYINGNDEKPCSSYSASFANAVEPQGIDSDSMVAAGANDAESHAKSTKKLNKKCKVKKKLQNEGKQQGPKILPTSATTTTATITGTTANNTFTKSSKSKRLTTNGGSNYQRQQKSLTNNSNKLNTNNSSSNSNSNSNSNNNKYKNYSSNNHGAALSSLITFILLLIVNIVLIYMIMFKNPQIAEKLVEAIPYQYRDWILSKTEIFRLRVTDWISQFRTPPDEH